MPIGRTEGYISKNINGKQEHFMVWWKQGMDKYNYLIAKGRNVFWVGLRRIVGARKFKRDYYYGKRIKGYDEANTYIYEALMSGEPFLAARFGDAELRALVYTIERDLGLRNSYPDYIKKVMHLNAGFFPADDENLPQFGHLLWESSRKVDVFGVWYNLLEDYVIHETNANAELVVLEALEPYRSSFPWSRALAGRKVLVIHPFSESIKLQYSRHDKLFENKDVLPDFELITYKAIQTNAGGTTEYTTWFEALDAMFDDIKQISFDVAIVGCGAYGLPLSARIKDMGKQVIHLAGATQILFGIRGARWDIRPEMQQYFNEYWIRPSESEKPINANAVEGGCYW